MDCSVWMTGNVATPVAFRTGASASGQKWARADFRLACNRRTRQPDGQWSDAGTTFVTVVAWRSLAEGIFSSIERGDPVVVCGRLATDEWVDKNGETQSRLTVVADSVGHDLARGRAKFAKNPTAPPPAAADADPDAAASVPGQEGADPAGDLDGYTFIDVTEPVSAG